MNPAGSVTPTPEPVLTHPCVRCGTPIPLDDAMCERCNPLGLKQPASSQAHGTVFLGIAIAVLALAVLGRYVVVGIGPFTGHVTAVAAAPPNLMVTLSVRNEGTRAGSVTCRVYDPSVAGIGPDSSYVLSPDIPPGTTMTFTKPVTTLGSTVKTLAADCGG